MKIIANSKSGIMEKEEKFMFELVVPNVKHYNRLVELKNQYPKLTFDNKGYEYLSKEIKESHKEQLEEITEILRKTLKGFSRFEHFKLRKDGSIDVRAQYKWDVSFTGVGYFNIEHWNPENHGKY